MKIMSRRHENHVETVVLESQTDMKIMSSLYLPYPLQTEGRT